VEVCSSICMAFPWSFIFCSKDEPNRNETASSNEDSAFIRVARSLLSAALWHLSLDMWVDHYQWVLKLFGADYAASIELRAPDVVDYSILTKGVAAPINHPCKPARPQTDWAAGVIQHCTVGSRLGTLVYRVSKLGCFHSIFILWLGLSGPERASSTTMVVVANIL